MASTCTKLHSSKNAIRMAAGNLDVPEGAILHSDCGSNYTLAEFVKELTNLGIRQSVGLTGICYDNALALQVAQGNPTPGLPRNGA
jgi:transposase InsO family protein